MAPEAVLNTRPIAGYGGRTRFRLLSFPCLTEAPPMRHAARTLRITLVAVVMAGCADTSEPIVPDTARPFRMGFGSVPPSDDFPLAVRTLETWVTRADAAIIHFEPPWPALLTGESPASVAAREYDGLVNFWRQRGLDLVIVVDPSNGVDRASDSDNLRRAGRSLTEPAIQQLYRQWVTTLVTRYRPQAIGLAVETNLVRAAAPPAFYEVFRRVVNEAAIDVRAVDATVPRFVTVQVETAWGRLAGLSGYTGIDRDFTDFPFGEWLGLSSYPYLGRFDEPEQVPDDYYRRLLNGRTVPVLVTEGGWTSGTGGGVTGSLDKQARWIRRNARLTASVRGRYLFQLTFTDLTNRVFGPDPRLEPFLRLGLVDTTLAPKPALAVWDSVFALPRQP